jgi:hypothetical protein
MNLTLLAIFAGAAFGLWSLLMSLTGLRAGGVVFMLLAGTILVTVPWFLLVRPGPWLDAGRDPRTAVAAGLGAACVNGIGMVLLPPLLDGPPGLVGTRVLVLNVAVVSVVAAWTISFGGEGLTASKVVGVVFAIAAVWLLGR